MTDKNVFHVEVSFANKDLLLKLLNQFSSLNQLGEKIMSAISDFAVQQQLYNDSLAKSLDGLSSDIKNLDDQIAALQASPGAITPADQVLLDGISAASKSLADKFAALDNLTPPVVPPVAPKA